MSWLIQEAVRGFLLPSRSLRFESEQKMMQPTRREFNALATMLVLAPNMAVGGTSMRKVALVSPTVAVDQMAAGGHASWSAFIKELERLGFADGVNIAFQRYSGNGDARRYAEIGRAAVHGAPDVVFIGGSAPATQAAIAESTGIPIVFSISDAMAFGLVESMSHPGGHATGVSTSGGLEVEGKRLSLLYQAAPEGRRVAVVTSAASWSVSRSLLQEVAAAMNLEITPWIVHEPAGESTYHELFAAMAAQRIDMVQMTQTPENNTYAGLIGRLTYDWRLPGIAHVRGFVDGGGLMSYGSNSAANYRLAAGYVARILNGATAGDLPVMQPVTFDFVVSLDAAALLGLSLPPILLASATEIKQ